MVKLFVLILTNLLTTNILCAAEMITMGSDEWFPFVGNSVHRGYIIEIADQVFSEQGLQLNYFLFPWARVILKVRNGTMNAAPGMLKEDAPDFIFHEEPIGEYVSSFFVYKTSSWKYSGISSLAGKRLGAIIDYLYEDNLDAYIKKELARQSQWLQIVGGNDPLKSNIRKLCLGRIDITVENPSVFYYKIKSMGLSASLFREVPLNANKRWLYIGFSPADKNSPRYARILSDGIRKLRKSGKLVKILDKYGVKDWK